MNCQVFVVLTPTRECESAHTYDKNALIIDMMIDKGMGSHRRESNSHLPPHFQPLPYCFLCPLCLLFMHSNMNKRKLRVCSHMCCLLTTIINNNHYPSLTILSEIGAYVYAVSGAFIHPLTAHTHQAWALVCTHTGQGIEAKWKKAPPFSIFHLPS